VMVRINEGVPARPLVTEVPEATYMPIDPSSTEGAILPEDVPYFDDPNAPLYNGEFYEVPEAYYAPMPDAYSEPLPEAYTAPMPDAYVAPLPDWLVEEDLADQILMEVLGTVGN